MTTRAMATRLAQVGRRTSSEDRVDLRELDEVLDLDRPGLLGLQRLELAGLDDHVAVGRELEALDDVVVGDLIAGRRVDALLRYPHA